MKLIALFKLDTNLVIMVTKLTPFAATTFSQQHPHLFEIICHKSNKSSINTFFSRPTILITHYIQHSPIAKLFSIATNRLR